MSFASAAGTVFSVLAALVLPFCAVAVLKKKTGRGLLAAGVGAVCFVVFASVLEQLLHSVVLPHLMGTPWLYGLYGCLAAGVFEETARLAGLSLLCRTKKGDGSLATGLGYGLGHGGIEAVLLAGLPLAGALLGAVYAAAGVAAPLPLAQWAAQVAAQPWLLTWAAGLERLVALSAQIALSVLVWMAVTKRACFRWYFAAIGLHAALDVPAVLGQLGILKDVFVLEGMILAFTAALCVFVATLYHRAAAHRLPCCAETAPGASPAPHL